MARPSANQSSNEPLPTVAEEVGAAAAQLEQQEKNKTTRVSLLILLRGLSSWKGMATFELRAGNWAVAWWGNCEYDNLQKISKANMHRIY